MPGPVCRIKLYGHTGKDVEEFSKKLASVLRIEESQAERIVRDLPVVIKDGLDKEDADKLVAILAAIRGLCIIEYEGTQPVEEKPAATAPAKTTAAGVVKPVKERDSMRSALWMALVVGLVGFLVLFSVGAYISSYINLYRKEPVKEEATEQVSPQEPLEETEIDEKKVIEIETRIEKLEEELKDLRTNRASAQKDLEALQRQPKPDAAQLYRSREYVSSLDTRMKNVNNELGQLKQQLRSMKKE